MIYNDVLGISESSFLDLLDKTKRSVVEKLRYSAENASGLSGDAFEALTYEEACKCAEGTEFEGHIKRTEDREFPDIIAAGYYGIEVKATKKDAWTSIGNSVLESSRDKNVEKIYIFFGKLGGAPDVKYRKYEDCLRGIAVTHYPRYQIDMNLADGQSIFDLMHIPYDALRKDSNPVKPIRSYYEKNLKPGQELWWVSDDIDDSTASTPVIQTFSSQPTEIKKKLKAEAFVRFPEIFSNSTTKFESVAAYWITKYNVVCSNVRDQFTAGGQSTFSDAEGREYTVPAIVGRLIELAPHIEEFLKEHPEEASLNNEQNLHVGEPFGRRNDWLDTLNGHSRVLDLPLQLSVIYEQNRLNAKSIHEERRS